MYTAVLVPVLTVMVAMLTVVTTDEQFWNEPTFRYGFVLVLVLSPLLAIAFTPARDVNALDLSVRVPYPVALRVVREVVTGRSLPVEAPGDEWRGYDEVVELALGGRTYRMGILGQTSRGPHVATTLTFRPLPPREDGAFAGFQRDLEARLGEANEADQRLQAPVTDTPRVDQVTYEGIYVRWTAVLMFLPVCLAALGAIPYGVWSLVTRRDELEPHQVLALLMVTTAFLSLSWLMVLIVHGILHTVLTDRVEVGRDGVESRRGRWKLMGIQFGPEVVVDVFQEHGDEVSGYRFSRGLRSIDVNDVWNTHGEELEQLWPLVMTAAWEHRMELGPRLRGMLREGTGPPHHDESIA